VSTENSPRLCLFPHHPLRSRTVGQACRLPQRQAWGQKEEPFNPGYTLARPHLAPITLACGYVTGTGLNREPHRIFGTVVHVLNPVFGKKPDISGRDNSYV
jgi:hypothetical protein